jgi:hypothetical protein
MEANMTHPSDLATAAVVSTLASRAWAPAGTLCAPDCPVAAEFQDWGLELNSALLVPLGKLELAVRGTMQRTLESSYGRADWWTNPALVLRLKEHDTIAKAGSAAAQAGSELVDELSFGFWVTLASAGSGNGQHDYETRLWRPTLRHAFPHFSGRRRELHRDLNNLRILRNAVAHHRPIHHRDLARDVQTIYRAITWICPETAARQRAADRVTALLATRPAPCPELAAASLRLGTQRGRPQKNSETGP